MRNIESNLNLLPQFWSHSSASIVKNSDDNNLGFDGTQQAGQLRTRIRVAVEIESIDLRAA